MLYQIVFKLGEYIEKVVPESVKTYMAVMIDREELKLSVIQQESDTKSELESRIKMERRAIKTLEDSMTDNITALVSGKITKEVFLNKKKTINDTIAKKNTELESICKKLKILSEGRASVEQWLLELRPLTAIEKLDRELADLLIDKVLIHGEKDIEIVWLDKWQAVD